jgi:hypothetical protein
MLKDLIKLANNLDSKGLTKEADYLDQIINKSAQYGGDDFVDVSKAPSMYPYGKPKPKQKGRVFFPEEDNKNPLLDKKDVYMEDISNATDEQAEEFIDSEYERNMEYYDDSFITSNVSNADEDPIDNLAKVIKEIMGSGKANISEKAEKFLDAIGKLDYSKLTKYIKVKVQGRSVFITDGRGFDIFPVYSALGSAFGQIISSDDGDRWVAERYLKSSIYIILKLIGVKYEDSIRLMEELGIDTNDPYIDSIEEYYERR